MMSSCFGAVVSFPLIFFDINANVVQRADIVKLPTHISNNVFGSVVLSIRNAMRPVVRGIAVAVVPLCSVD